MCGPTWGPVARGVSSHACFVFQNPDRPEDVDGTDPAFSGGQGGRAQPFSVPSWGLVIGCDFFSPLPNSLNPDQEVWTVSGCPSKMVLALVQSLVGAHSSRWRHLADSFCTSKPKPVLRLALNGTPKRVGEERRASLASFVSLGVRVPTFANTHPLPLLTSAPPWVSR